MIHRRVFPVLVASVLMTLAAVSLAACGGGGQPRTDSNSASTGGTAGSLRLYTSISQETLDTVLAPWHKQHPDTRLQLFRAPSGQINARLAAEQRSGGIRADVIWGPDPVNFYGYDSQHLLLHWTPSNVDNVPVEDRGPTFWGTTILRLIIIVHRGFTPVPRSWADLTEPTLQGKVEVPDPAIASSAMGALAYFTQTPGYGLEYFRKLKANGAVQVDSPDTVVTDVATGRAEAGIALDFSAAAARKQGSPIELVYPAPGAIGIYGAAGVVHTSKRQAAARQFVEYLLSPQAQHLLAEAGRQPVLRGAPSTVPPGTRTVTPDWTKLADSGPSLLDRYEAIFGSAGS